MIRLYVHTGFFERDLSYQSMDSIIIPNPHISGYWERGFEFNNDAWLLLGVF